MTLIAPIFYLFFNKPWHMTINQTLSCIFRPRVTRINPIGFRLLNKVKEQGMQLDFPRWASPKWRKNSTIPHSPCIQKTWLKRLWEQELLGKNYFVHLLPFLPFSSIFANFSYVDNFWHFLVSFRSFSGFFKYFCLTPFFHFNCDNFRPF